MQELIKIYDHYCAMAFDDEDGDRYEGKARKQRAKRAKKANVAVELPVVSVVSQEEMCKDVYEHLSIY